MDLILRTKNFVCRVIKNSSIRLRASLSFGIVINFVYLAGNLISAIMYNSLWSATVTVYHLLFMLARMYILYAEGRGKHLHSKFGVCFRVGVFLLVLDLLAAVMMTYSINSGGRAKYGGLVLLFFLFYTVYSLASSIYGIKKWRNDNKPLHFTARNMSLASALMSVFNLQFSIFTTIGLDSYTSNRIISLSGFLVLFVIIFLAVRLIMSGVNRGIQ